jgi:hypothetical protein
MFAVAAHQQPLPRFGRANRFIFLAFHQVETTLTSVRYYSRKCGSMLVVGGLAAQKNRPVLPVLYEYAACGMPGGAIQD